MKFIVCIDAENGVGKKGTMPWCLPEYHKFVKFMTLKESGWITALADYEIAIANGFISDIYVVSIPEVHGCDKFFYLPNDFVKIAELPLYDCYGVQTCLVERFSFSEVFHR
jgi:dihydrofolate reductase